MFKVKVTASQALKKLGEAINLILRGEKGYGTGNPWSPHQTKPPLGKSSMEEFIEKNSREDAGSGDEGGGEDDEEFKVSKAFTEEDERDID